ncbi:hypothetical protein [Pseudomonas sp. LF-5]|uniref:hypothetical protein n=1 Tax=Pseudomonas TaxID=286 RepID=UPI00309DAA2C
MIASYNGLIPWVLIGCERYASSGMNWVIESAYIKEVEAKAKSLGQSSASYLAKYEPEFGSIAFEDLVGLTEYIRKKFSVDKWGQTTFRKRSENVVCPRFTH